MTKTYTEYQTNLACEFYHELKLLETKVNKALHNSLEKPDYLGLRKEYEKLRKEYEKIRYSVQTRGLSGLPNLITPLNMIPIDFSEIEKRLLETPVLE